MEITLITPSELIASFAHGDDVSRDLETFNKFRPIEFSIRLLKDALLSPPTFYGLTVNTHDAYRAYARHVWQQTRKPRSVYRGGRWRQMDLLTRHKAIVWAKMMEQTAEALYGKAFFEGDDVGQPVGILGSGDDR